MLNCTPPPRLAWLLRRHVIQPAAAVVECDEAIAVLRHSGDPFA